MDLTRGLGGLQQLAGRAAIVFKWSFLGVEEIGERDGEKKDNEEDRVENLPFLHDHRI